MAACFFLNGVAILSLRKERELMLDYVTKSGLGSELTIIVSANHSIPHLEKPVQAPNLNSSISKRRYIQHLIEEKRRRKNLLFKAEQKIIRSSRART